MDPHEGKIVLNGAPSQYDRWLPALDPGYARPDDRSFPQLLNFASRYGSLIHFYNLQNRIDGDWAPFFSSDVTMILAAIMAFDPIAIERAFSRQKAAIQETAAFEAKFALLRNLFEVITGAAGQINSWFAGMGLSAASATARLLELKIVSLIGNNLRSQLQRLKAYSGGAALPNGLGQPLDVTFNGFLPIWKLEEVAPETSVYAGETGSQKVDHAVPLLDSVFGAFMDAILELKQFALMHFPETLAGDNHKPFLALYMAFLRLFETAQNTLNTMSQRYRHFYYHDILRTAHQPAIPDSVYLAFVLDDAEEATSATVPAGTLFPAGQDAEGTDIVYASDQAALVTAAAISSLRNVRVVSGPLFLPAPPAPPSKQAGGAPTSNAPQRVFVSKISVAAMNSQTAPPPAWPTFGSEVIGDTDVVKTAPATLGFAIASDYLMLTGGRRTIIISFEYSCDCLADIAEATGLEADAVLAAVLNGGQDGAASPQTFQLFMSTAMEWLPVLSYSVEADRSKFSLGFELPASIAPVVPITAEPQAEAGDVNATNPSPGLPTLKAYLQQLEPILLAGTKGRCRVYPVSVLTALQIQKIRIFTQTKGLDDLNLRNTDGPVNAAAPFAVFGGTPVPGSFLQLSNVELFKKIPVSLSITLQWFNLPPNLNGFAGYYQDYVIGLSGQYQPDLFSNQTFRGVIRVKDPGPWDIKNVWSDVIEGPPPQEPDLFLFRTKVRRISSAGSLCDYPVPERDGPLCEATGFDTLRVETTDPPPYYKPETSAIRLSLTAPAYGFGSDLYMKNVLQAVLQDQSPPDISLNYSWIVCEALWNAFQGVEKCLEECRDKALECLPGCLEECQRRLLVAFQEAFQMCLSQCEDLPPTSMDDLRNIFGECAATPNADETPGQLPELPPAPADIAHCIYDRLLTSDWLKGCARNCWNNCVVLLEAIFWIEECNGLASTDVDLAGEFNIENAIVRDGTTFTGGMDPYAGYSYSYEALPSVVVYKGSAFNLGPPNSRDAVYGKRIPFVPQVPGTFAELHIAGAISTPVVEALPTFTIDYLASPEQVIRQRMSSWQMTNFRPQPWPLPGETIVAEMPYFDRSDGTRGLARNYLYAYSFTLHSDGILTGLTLPPEHDRMVAILAIKLIGSKPTPEAMTKQVEFCALRLQDAYRTCLKAQPTLMYPNPPWTPVAEKVSLDYAAQCRFSPGAEGAAAAKTSVEGNSQFFYLLPFDGYAPGSASQESAPSLLPQFPFAGSLYIGFSDLVQQQPLSLLFQMAAGSAPDLPAPEWQYLDENSWRNFDAAAIRLDTTNGLKNSGILSLDLPRLHSARTTSLPAENQWLRAMVREAPELFAETAGIYPHVVPATWQNNSGAGENLRQPLEPFTINSSVQALPEIAEIIQPMKSFGGRARQNHQEFAVYLGERLRHKDRANLSWDYERLVLDHFPEIWKVQALPARSLHEGRSPGDVLVVVVAGEKSLEVADPAIPAATPAMLQRIHDFLEDRASPFVSLHVVNPVYVRITVTARILLQEGEAAGERIEQLNTELVKYLSPWFYDAERAAQRGDYAAPDAISEFIQNQPYVAALIQVDLEYDPDPATLEWYFLTSAASHRIREENALAARATEN